MASLRIFRLTLLALVSLTLMGCSLAHPGPLNSEQQPSSSAQVRPRSRAAEDDEFYYGNFPDDFLWGLATSAYQIEGAWNISDKGESIWDKFAHTPGTIDGGATGDVAADSYHMYEKDVEALKNMGAHFYRFSIAWSRIMPDGTSRNVSQDGIDYYNRLINALVREGIIPMVTLFHWDLPQALQDSVGGWPGHAVASHFGDYARICYREFGDRVKHWITFNEPWVFCNLGYAFGSHAPGIREPAELPYQCGHTVIMSHGYAYRIYDEEFRRAQGGQVGITLDSSWAEPRDPSNPDDVAASERSMQFGYGWYAYTLNHGEYPPIMRQLVDEKSAAEGRNQSRLPHFDPFWTQMINGTLDFYGVNHYTTSLVFTVNRTDPGHGGDQNTGSERDPSWPGSSADWLWVVPWGLRKLLTWIDREYNSGAVKKPIYVTENGFADYEASGVSDPDRVNYYRLYTNEMLKAINLDGANVKGYTAWSLIDNLEWAAGYSQRFGVHWINWTDPELTRVPKESAIFLTQLFQDNGFPEPKNKPRSMSVRG